MIIQLTGLSGAGKTTIATRTREYLASWKVLVEIIDGDIYRQSLCKDLGFSREDRIENIRRLGALAHQLSKREIPAIISAINPYEVARHHLVEAYGAKTVWVNCAIDVLVQRDTKGLYRKAMLPSGHPERISNLTGVNDVYEAPEMADLILYTDLETPDQSVERLSRFILAHLTPFQLQ